MFRRVAIKNFSNGTKFALNPYRFSTKIYQQRCYSTGKKESEIKPETEMEKALKEAMNQPPTVENAPVKKSLWERIKEEARHYRDGSRLLVAETKISSRLLIKLLKGQKLSRREYRQLKRTVMDLLRIVPLLIIVAIPMLELALPILLRIFPNMLPSTFESKFQEEERKRNLLKLRIKMAKFLQETVSELELQGTSSKNGSNEFTTFFNNLKTSGEQASAADILNIAKRFQDELTLTNLSRPQLVHLARFMNLNAIGTDSFLRYTIELKLKEIKNDDYVLQKEGVDSLNISELQNACMQRGIASYGVSGVRMRQELEQWLDLHLTKQVPGSLLLLSHAFQTATRKMPGADSLENKAEALQVTLSSLPHQVINEAKLNVSEREGVATPRQKLEVLKEQEELIEDELHEDRIQEERKKEEMRKKAEEERKKLELETKLTEEIKTKETESNEKVYELPIVAKATEATVSSANVIEEKGETVPSPTQGEEKEVEISDIEIKRIAEALKTMSTDSALEDVKATLESLKADRLDFIEDVEEYRKFTLKEGNKSSKRFGQRVDKMISSIEDEIAKYDNEIGANLNLIKPIEGNISVADLEQTLRVIRDHPEDSRIKEIIKKLDSDGDGLVAMEEILAMAEGDSEGHGILVDIQKIGKEKEKEKRDKENREVVQGKDETVEQPNGNKSDGLGVDLTRTSRFQRLLNKHRSAQLISKMLTISERNEFVRLQLNQQAQFLSVRWACKEALYKAGIHRRFIEMGIKKVNGKPMVDGVDEFICEVSVAHDGDLVIANAIIFTK